MINNQNQPHFVLVPLLAQGHIIPMLDIAHLLADQGAFVSFITTPTNAIRIQAIITRAKASSLPIQFVEFNFPCVQGLPVGCENVDQVPSQEMNIIFFESLSLFQEPFDHFLRETNPRPSCIISDFSNHWTMEAAKEFNIPRFIFHGPSCFFIHSTHSIRQSGAYEVVDNEFEPVVVPNLPQRIEISRAQSPVWFSGQEWEKMRDKVFESEATATGIVMNTFYELEPEYVDRYTETMGKKVWPIGPVSLYNKDVVSQTKRGNKASIDDENEVVISWLDSMQPRSVLYVNFGSSVKTKTSQLIEIGCGLEASNLPFIWVIKEVEKCEEVDKWMAKGFKERVRERSLVITGWVPQLLILSHLSIGGFMTHCGWNSTLESISAGVPMVTWPHFLDQFLNEKLVVEVLHVGVALGVKVPFHYVKEGDLSVKRDEVRDAVLSLMDRGVEGEQRRERARELRDKAHKAMEESGSSHKNLIDMIQFVLQTVKDGV